ncbi:MAG: lipid-A-disaccharide synthase [Mesorhizobium sp.]|nr:lipid-A-disaccharide synthase [Mesorhizobium sp.]
MRPLRLGILAGEESGDQLGADLVRALRAMSGRDVELIGVGGPHLQALGLKTLFDPGEIAIMGISAVLRDLPRLLGRIATTAQAVAAADPDCLVTIDSPEFSLRVAKKVRAANANIPIVKYVCPSVWAWRPGRAPAMKPFVDHILCLLPFEPAALARLGGPPGTFVGHRMTHDAGLLEAARVQAAHLPGGGEKTLLVLPGSRRAEVKALLGPFGEAVSILKARGHRMKLLLPTVSHVAELVRSTVAGWEQAPEIIVEPAGKWRAFATADAALIASGTVSLELALVGVPMVSCYKVDPLARLAQGLITTWSALLPNLVSDRALVPEFYNQYVRPENLARQVEALWSEGPLRAWQKDGFAEVARRMATDRPSGEIAAEIVLREIGKSAVGSRQS